MTLLADARMYGRFAVGLRRFLRQRLTRGEAEAIIADRLARRESNFFRLLERGIYGYTASPYRALLRLARVELEDVRALVATRGLEGALAALREAGVSVSFEAFKGREPIVRNGCVITVKPRDFDNPFVQRHYEVESSGSTGAGTRVSHDLDHLGDRAPHYVVAGLAHGILKTPIVFWRPVLPAGSGINGMLVWARVGNPPVKWFTPVTHDDLHAPAKFRIATQAIVAGSRLFGVRLPFPDPAPLAEAARVARYVARIRDERGACVLRTSVSLALRACLAATAGGLDLTGVTVLAGGEPTSQTKVAGITATGARFVPAYFFAETGSVAWGCARPSSVDDMHFFEDSLALVQSPRALPGTGVSVDTFHFTTLLPSAPKLMLNVEIDDYGVVERRSCGCALEAYGFTRHLTGVRSFSKLNGEGVTLVGSQMTYVLEHVLPSRFGGSALDYQLVEDENAQGITRLTLVISPRVELSDDREPVKVLLAALAAGGAAADLARGIWAQADTFSVRREEPHVTSAGKQMTLRPLRRHQA